MKTLVPQPYDQLPDDVTSGARAALTSAEAWALAALAIPVSTILGAYALDSVGLTFGPWLMLSFVLACFAGVATYGTRRSSPAPTDTGVFIAIVVGLTAWLLWLARPT